MGKGLIPADLETWKPRRRAIVPAFHRAWLGAMVAMFNACTQESVRKLDSAVAAAGDAVRLGACSESWHCERGSWSPTSLHSPALGRATWWPASARAYASWSARVQRS